MEDHFGAATAFVRRQNAALKCLDTIRPRSHDTPYSLLGTAVDYRIRFYFEDAASQPLVAEKGAMLLARGDGPLYVGNALVEGPLDGIGPRPALDESCVSRFFCALMEFLDGLPAGRRLEPSDEETLCRFCVVLAYFEQAFRAGPERMADTSLVRDSSPAVEDLLGIAHPDWVEDLAAQSRLFLERSEDRVVQPHILNPDFEGSRDVGGADADLIIGSALIDIKATVNPKIESRWLWQLLGYALLDYTDQYCIDTVGVYLSRQGRFLEWPIDELAQQLATQHAICWDDVRAEFQQTTSTMLARTSTANPAAIRQY